MNRSFLSFVLAAGLASSVQAVPLAELTGQESPLALTDFLAVDVVAPLSDPETGYEVDASSTDNPASNENVQFAFTFTATGLAAGDALELSGLAFDYTQINLAGSRPELHIFVDTGAGYGDDAIFTFTEVPASSRETRSLSFLLDVSLREGESVTFGFAFQDIHTSPVRRHLINHLVLSGLFDLVSTEPGIDLNNNGASDIWEYQFDATALVNDEELRNSDYDGDGFTNLEEAKAGTDPRRAGSVLALDFVEGLLGGGEAGFNFGTVLGKEYTVLTSETLEEGSWIEELVLTGDGEPSLLAIDLLGGADSLFYRVGVSDVDADGDRLSLFEEQAVSGFFDTNPTSNGVEGDFERLKGFVQSALESEVEITTSGGTTLYEEEGNQVALTVTRTSVRNDGFINLSNALSYQIIDTTRVASNAASAADYRIVDAAGNELIDGLFTLAEGVASATVYVEAVPDSVIEADEQLTFSLANRSDINLWVGDAAVVAAADSIAIAQAGHFLSQASMGGTPETISALANEIQAKGLLVAFEDWIDAQMVLPRESSVTEDCYAHQAAYVGSAVPSVNIQNFELVWWGKMVQTEEQFRHRMAFTLSQVFVTSSAFWANAERNDLWRSYTCYYDKLANAVDGSHRDLLQTISYDPFMGVYLSSAQNRKANVALGTSPDENYAREVMQLFSCGVFTQNQNGEYQVVDGRRLENYDNEDITELAEVFTGLGLVRGDGALDDFNNPRMTLGSRYFHPMQMVAEHHDLSTKILLDGSVLPAGQSGDQDVSDALDALAEHASTAPHLARLLIQRLTNSNPSSAYLGRVTEAWRGEGPYGNGSDDVGNFLSIFKAILLDPEARQGVSYSVDSATGAVAAIPNSALAGRLKEPIIKWTQFYRFAQSLSFDDDGLPRWRPLTKRAANDQTPDFGQIPMRAPSVFNFYDSAHSPAVGDLAEAEETFGVQLVSPESEILSPYVIRQFEAFYQDVVKEVPASEFSYDANGQVFTTEYNYVDYLYRKNETVGDFLDDVNLWFCNGQISPQLKADLVAVANSNGGATRENFAGLLSIIFNSSDFSVSH